MKASACARVHAQHGVTAPGRTNVAALPLLRPPDWTRRAACRHWVELDWIDPAPELTALYRAVCAGCPVRWECLVTALNAAEPWGIWGGPDIDERADLARQGGFPPPNVVPHHGLHTRYVRHHCRCDACRYAYERERRRRRKAAGRSGHRDGPTRGPVEPVAVTGAAGAIGSTGCWL